MYKKLYACSVPFYSHIQTKTHIEFDLSSVESVSAIVTLYQKKCMCYNCHHTVSIMPCPPCRVQFNTCAATAHHTMSITLCPSCRVHHAVSNITHVLQRPITLCPSRYVHHAVSNTMLMLKLPITVCPCDGIKRPMPLDVCH